MTGVKKKSRYYGKVIKKGDNISKAYNENPNRRIQIPDWRFYSNIIDFINQGAISNEVTRSRFFETVIKNHFLLHKTFFIANSSIDTSLIENKSKRIKLFIHPVFIEMIKKYALQSNCTATRYLTLLFQNYKLKYGAKIDISQLI
jgi:hypothetical protein